MRVGAGISGLGRVLAKAVSAFEMRVHQNAVPITVYPNDANEGTVPGPDPQRVVVLGDWNARGVGITTYELSLAAGVARDVAARTSRGASWKSLTIDDFRVVGVPAAVADDVAAFSGADIVILVLGAAEAMSFDPAREWRENLGVAIEVLLGAMDDRGCLVIAEIPPLGNLGVVSTFVGRELGLQIAALNSVTRDLAEHYSQVAACPFPKELAAVRWETDGAVLPFARTNAVWARSMVDSLLGVR